MCCIWENLRARSVAGLHKGNYRQKLGNQNTDNWSYFSRRCYLLAWLSLWTSVLGWPSLFSSTRTSLGLLSQPLISEIRKRTRHPKLSPSPPFLLWKPPETPQSPFLHLPGYLGLPTKVSLTVGFSNATLSYVCKKLMYCSSFVHPSVGCEVRQRKGRPPRGSSQTPHVVKHRANQSASHPTSQTKS